MISFISLDGFCRCVLFCFSLNFKVINLTRSKKKGGKLRSSKGPYLRSWRKDGLISLSYKIQKKKCLIKEEYYDVASEANEDAERRYLCIFRMTWSDANSKDFKDSRCGFQRNLRQSPSGTDCVLETWSLRITKSSNYHFYVVKPMASEVEKFLMGELGLLQNDKIFEHMY